jgi:hypothetical protein
MTSDIPTSLGQHIWDIRHTLGLSVPELAILSGVNAYDIHDIEDDWITPSRDVLKSLLEALNSVNRLEDLCVLGRVR